MDVQPSPPAKTTIMPPKAAPRKSATSANGHQLPPPLTSPNALLASAPINAPWTPVFDSSNTLIPYLQQTTIRNVTVRKNAQSTTTTKTVRFLLLTHSDGGRLIHDHTGFTEPQYCLPDNPRYLGLMCQLGESLVANLGISSSSNGGGGGGGGNKSNHDDGGTWDALVQLPLKYNAYYKSRKAGGGSGGGGGGAEHLDLYIAGHDAGKFDSVKQYAVHLAWLARENDGRDEVKCDCKVCGEERKKGFRVEGQMARKGRWAEHQGPLMEGVPDWRA